MTRDPLNPFQPYERLPAHHENQLTRALLIVLRLCPMAHSTWLRLVDKNLDLGKMGAASFQTQRREIPIEFDSEQEPSLISVFLTPEVPLARQGEVTESERTQILDAIIGYSQGPFVVVENKVVEDSIAQAEELNTGGRIPLPAGQAPVIVRWRELIESFSNLLEQDLVGGGERVLLEDFLTYTEDHFESLGPYRSLALCGDSSLRINRRLRAILGEAGGADATIDSYGPTVDFGGQGYVASRAYLFQERREELQLTTYPADTLTQAREFFGDPKAVAAVMALAERQGWGLWPNFHFGYMETGYCWTHTSLSVETYVDYWLEKISSTSAVKRGDWDGYWKELVEAGIASPEDRPGFDRHFTDSRRPTATPRPGLSLTRFWDFNEARELDSAGRLIPEVRQSLEEMRQALAMPSA